MITGCTQAADYIQMQPDCMLHDKREQLKKAAKTQKEEMIMASRSSNRAAVPEAKSALDKFKYEVAKSSEYRYLTATTETLPPNRTDLWADIWSRK